MDIRVSGGNPDFPIKLSQKEEGGIIFVSVSASCSRPAVPSGFRLEFDFPIVDCYSVWSPSMGTNRCLGPDWWCRRTASRIASWMPVHQIVSLSGKNRICIAVSDATTPIDITTGACEEDANLKCGVEFFTRPTAPLSEYSALIRIDLRSADYYDCIYDTVAWWEKDCGYAAAPVPEAARLPMDSLWYSFHQRLDVPKILSQCRLSKALGMETVIIDDGWQTDDNSRGYAFCGDWKVAEKKISSMRSLVDSLHAIGMKVMLWYSVPFVGVHSEKYSEFRDMLLDGTGDNRTFFALDPRYPEVREYLTGVYSDAVESFGLDGLKLDFIDSFHLSGKSLEPDPRRDITSLEEAVDTLMSGIKASLTAIRPDILIEFRQSYVGPSIRKYGNMLRVGDCPADPIQNRRGIVDLRFTSGKTAVHSDMLMWNPADPVETAAVEIASTLYSVPQISVLIDTLPADHKKMLSFYLGFWREYRDVLLDGKLTASHPEICYSLVCSEKDGCAVFTAYTENVVPVSTERAVAVNCTGTESLILRSCSGKAYRVLNCMGEEISNGTAAGELFEVRVPTAGMVFVG